MCLIVIHIPSIHRSNCKPSLIQWHTSANGWILWISLHSQPYALLQWHPTHVHVHTPKHGLLQVQCTFSVYPVHHTYSITQRWGCYGKSTGLGMFTTRRSHARHLSPSCTLATHPTSCLPARPTQLGAPGLEPTTSYHMCSYFPLSRAGSSYHAPN